ncbi:UMP kinase [Candidatus Saccharibacteria bacterium CPR2]|nr:UMP kinase [Candidatus Saccharibacteria bacterium CPR2]
MSKQDGYRRILLKLSGEQLAGKSKSGIDPEFVGWLAEEIKKVVDVGAQVVIVVGGGNFVRGASFSGHGLERATADYMGMLATIINGLALMDMLESKSQPTRLQTNLTLPQVAEPFIRRRAIRHMEKNRVIIIAGGLGKPFITTDTAAVSVALELGCETVMKATKVNGVFTKDPTEHDDAEFLENLSYEEAIKNPDIQIMDKAALGLAMEHKMPIIVFDLLKEDNLVKAAQGGNIGSRIG